MNDETLILNLSGDDLDLRDIKDISDELEDNLHEQTDADVSRVEREALPGERVGVAEVLGALKLVFSSKIIEEIFKIFRSKIESNPTLSLTLKNPNTGMEISLSASHMTNENIQSTLDRVEKLMAKN